MGPYYDTGNIHKFARTPAEVRFLEGRHLDLDEPPSGNARVMFTVVMFVLAVFAYSVDLVGRDDGETDDVQVAVHSSRP